MFHTQVKFHQRTMAQNSYYQPYTTSVADVPQRAGKERFVWIVDLLNDFGGARASLRPLLWQ
eukprot:COSAG01_NODE_1990_length_8697_cov_5.164922_10_plen_62_part_00